MPDDLTWAGVIGAVGTVALAWPGRKQTGTIDGFVSQNQQPVACAVVLIDGAVIGLAAPTGQFVVSNITPGVHTVRIECTGMLPQEQAVTVQPGLVAGVTFVLEPLPTEAVPVSA